MADYDRSRVRKFASRLDRYARTTEAGYATALTLLAVSAGLLVDLSPLSLLVVGAIGAFVGYLWGRDKAFGYRLQSLALLLALRIEENTAAREEREGT